MPSIDEQFAATARLIQRYVKSAGTGGPRSKFWQHTPLGAASLISPFVTVGAHHWRTLGALDGALVSGDRGAVSVAVAQYLEALEAVSAATSDTRLNVQGGIGASYAPRYFLANLALRAVGHRTALNGAADDSITTNLNAAAAVVARLHLGWSNSPTHLPSPAELSRMIDLRKQFNAGVDTDALLNTEGLNSAGDGKNPEWDRTVVRYFGRRDTLIAALQGDGRGNFSAAMKNYIEVAVEIGRLLDTSQRGANLSSLHAYRFVSNALYSARRIAQIQQSQGSAGDAHLTRALRGTVPGGDSDRRRSGLPEPGSLAFMARSIGHRTVPDGWRNWDWDSSFPSVGQLNALLDGYLKRQQAVRVPGVVGAVGFRRRVPAAGYGAPGGTDYGVGQGLQDGVAAARRAQAQAQAQAQAPRRGRGRGR